MRCLRSIAITLLALLGLAVAGQPSRAADATIKIGYIDPFSGAFAAGRRRQPEDVPVHHRLHQRQGRRARQEVRAGHVRRQAAAGRGADRAEERHRPEPAVRHVVRRLQCRLGADRRGEQAQHAQPRQPGAAAQLRSACHRTDQRAVQLLAFPLRRQRGDARGGADQVAAAVGEVGLSAEPGLPVRPVDREGHQAVPRAVSPRHQDRRATSSSR